MTTSRTTRPNEQPIVELVNWQVYEAKLPCYESRTWHLVGDVGHGGRGTVTGPLLQVAPNASFATVKRGRRYVLKGPPGCGAEELWAFEVWRHLYESTDLLEITSEILKGCQPKPVKINKRSVSLNW